jgi:hypothetical protein
VAAAGATFRERHFSAQLRSTLAQLSIPRAIANR